LGLHLLSSIVRPLSSESAFAWRLAIFYAALFVALGVQLPFLPLWLAAKGLDGGAIGVALALPMVVRVFAIPLATRGADRHDALRATILIAAAMSVLGYAVVGLAQGAVAITMALVLASVFQTPVMPLADAYALRGLGGLKRAYGPVRLWGSAAFIVGSFGAGLLLERIAARDLIWLLVAALTITAAAAYALSPLPTREESPSATQPSSAHDLLRDPALVAAAAAASLIQASHAVYYGFSALDWQAAGLDAGAIGALWALAVVAEIALFAISGRLPLAPTTLLMLGAAAQGYLAVALGLVMAAAMGLSGVLYARFGGLAYGAMALAAAAGGIFALAAHRLGDGTQRRRSKLENDISRRSDTSP